MSLVDLGYIAKPEAINTAVATATDKAAVATTKATEAAASAAAAAAVGTTNDTVIAGRINDPASATATALTATISTLAAAEAANPETALNSAIVAIAQENSPTGLTVVRHGENASYARPAGASQVLWLGSVEPANMVDGDIWLLASEEPIAWSPLMLPTLQGWYSADDFAASADGAPVTSWLDKSGNGRNLTAVTGTPAVTVAGLNGHRGVSLTSDLMTSAAFAAVGAGVPLTLFATLKNTDPGSSTVTMVDGQIDSGAPSNGTLQFYKSSANKWGIRRAGSTYVSTANADTNAHVMHAIFDSNAISDPRGLWVDGVQVVASGVGVGTGVTQIAFGGRIGPLQLSQTIIGDFFWMLGRATDAQIAAAKAYLAAKSGIAVA